MYFDAFVPIWRRHFRAGQRHISKGVDPIAGESDEPTAECVVVDFHTTAPVDPDADVWTLRFNFYLVPAIDLRGHARDQLELDVADVSVTAYFRNAHPEVFGAQSLPAPGEVDQVEVTAIGRSQDQAGVAGAGVQVTRVVFELDGDVAECFLDPECAAMDIPCLRRLDLAVRRFLPLGAETAPLRAVAKIQRFTVTFIDIGQ